MKKITKLLSVVLMLTLTLSIIPVTEVRADETFSYTEAENNDSAQYANEVTVYSGTTTITGTVCYMNNASKGFVEDEFDWYKITFAENGKCDFQFFYNDSKDELSHNPWFKVYNQELAEISSHIYGYAHDADETIYLRVKAKPSSSSLGEYSIHLSDDTSAEYVGDNHCKTSTSYLLTEGQPAYVLGYSSNYPRYVAVKVPKGKKAVFTFAIDVDADLNEVIDNPFKVTVIRESDSEKLLSGCELTQDTVATRVVDRNTDKTLYEFTGANTYYIAISGDSSYVSYCNCQWISVKYDLEDAVTDKVKPTITGVKNGKTYTKAVTIKYKDASGIKSAKINGKNFKSGLKVSKAGSYTVTVVDKAGNKRTVKFKIKKK